ncbi:MAG: Asp23/Gls24 family envelope stress response protein [Candidatus Hydrogenedentes bacterium]|nr:Asp23/Gls24 family envelope stress response protein [Candidatus Hydrogenedentota bacterium]
MRILLKRIRTRLTKLDGVARLGGARRWWLLGRRVPGVRVRPAREGRLHFDVRLITEPGANVLALAGRVQDVVVETVGDRPESVVETVDVCIQPKG